MACIQDRPFPLPMKFLPQPIPLSAGRKGFRLLYCPVDPSGIYSFFLPAPPKVRLSLASKALPLTLICNIAGYYPPDVTVTWIREELGGAPVKVSDASFSSLRQSPAGTYSISSSLKVEPGSAGANYTCQVTHVSLDEPLRASTWAAPPEQRTMAFGVIFASSFFLLVLLYLGLQRWQGKSLGALSSAPDPPHS